MSISNVDGNMPASSRESASKSAGAVAVYANYYRRGYPVFSFLYALCCDKEFSNMAFNEWQNSYAKKEGYSSNLYLANYNRDPLYQLPAGAREIIAEEVPALPPVSSTGRRKPTRELAWKIMPYVVIELARLRPAKESSGQTLLAESALAEKDRKYPSLSGDHPVLSALAVICLHEKQSVDETRLKPYELSNEVRNHVLQIGKDTKDGKSPNVDDIVALTPYLVDEFTKDPAKW